MTALERVPGGTLGFIDATADVQAEGSAVPVDAGVAGLRTMFTSGKISMPVELAITTSTGLHRGVHMSRLVKAANSRKAKGVEQWVRRIAAEVDRTQPGSSVVCKYDIPYDDRLVEATIRSKSRGAMTYRFVVDGMTACPCSKKMIGVGHMQRARLTVVLKSDGVLDSMQVVGRISDCFSARTKEEMKRLEEAKKILEAQANPKFAEDLVRECVKRFPKALYVSGRCFESIHLHDAVAAWTAKPGWVPSF